MKSDLIKMTEGCHLRTTKIQEELKFWGLEEEDRCL